jgi:hypothetical protein
MKKSKQRSINSVSLERRAKNSPIVNIDIDVHRFPAKAVTIQSFTDDLSELALREKEVFQSNNRVKESPQTKINWRNFRRKPKQRMDK